MYKSQVRPAINGRVAQQPNRHPINSRFIRVALSTIYSQPCSLRRHSPIASLAFSAAIISLITGCGSLNYKSVGSANSLALSDVSCGTQSLTGPQTKTCSISLSASAITVATVKLSTTSSAVKVPSEVKIAAGQSSANFDVVTAGVSQTATVTITGSYGGVSKSAALTLYPAGTGSGSQTSAQHKVQLNWNAPAASSVALAGFNVYRATVGVSTYARLNPSINSATTYVDTSVQSGLTYDYVVRSVDSTGIESSPSNATEVKIP